MLAAAHVLAMDAKNLLDVVDSIRIRFPDVNQQIIEMFHKDSQRNETAEQSPTHQQEQQDYYRQQQQQSLESYDVTEVAASQHLTEAINNSKLINYDFARNEIKNNGSTSHFVDEPLQIIEDEDDIKHMLPMPIYSDAQKINDSSTRTNFNKPK